MPQGTPPPDGPPVGGVDAGSVGFVVGLVGPVVGVADCVAVADFVGLAVFVGVAVLRGATQLSCDGVCLPVQVGFFVGTGT